MGNRKTIAAFWRDESGATIVEFAFIAVILFTLLFIIIEFALIWLSSAMLENAMITAARYAKTNFSYSGSGTPDAVTCSNMPRDDTVRCMVGRIGGKIVDPNAIVFSTRVLGKNWGSADMASTVAGTGGKSDIVIYEAHYERELLNPLIRPFFTNGKYVIRASTIIQNEQ
ncbi:MAG: hypothetical protein C0436_02375 [Alphaproteobacteria bacterium]|nr:hypothetical protein [Alphaproteobacteria bacterium]